MAQLPTGVTEAERPELQVVARRILLDGLEALRKHAPALTVVGAQAIHLRSAEAGLAAPAFTSDADFGLDPRLLGDDPRLEQAMGDAGFARRDPDQPGLWAKEQHVAGRLAPVGVDLLVGETFAGVGRRSVEMPPHDKMAGRRVAGLEPATLDADELEIASLEPGDSRRLLARVAGPAALLVAKGYKLAERVAADDRLVDKDAADIVRLMLATEAEDTAARFERLLKDDTVAPVVQQGLRHLRELYRGASSPGVTMAARALAGDRLAGRVETIARTYLADLPVLS